jgi:hypothetical protein
VLACDRSQASPLRDASAPGSATRAGASEVDVKRAPDATAATIEDVGVDHGRADVAVAQQFLDGPDVVAGFQQVCGERMPQGVTARRLRNPGCAEGDGERTLDRGLMQVMAPTPAGERVSIEASGREDPLPGPLALRVRVFAGKCVR